MARLNTSLQTTIGPISVQAEDASDFIDAVKTIKKTYGVRKQVQIVYPMTFNGTSGGVNAAQQEQFEFEDDKNGN